MNSLLAMHMANELLSLPVAATTLSAAAAAVWLAARRAGRTLPPERLPLMGVMGAFVFAAQMINVTLPVLPGTSGHLGGGVLLAILLGPAAAIVTMAGILIVQCLLFQDGGLLALGCNILNLGVAPCLLGGGAYRLLMCRGGEAPPWRQYLAAWAACVLGVSAGAALVPLEAGVSGVLRIPAGQFLAAMLGVHLLIGLGEGAITFAVLAFLRQARPAALHLATAPTRGRAGLPAVLGSLLVTALLLGGVASWFASTHQDGLEWSLYGHDYGRSGPAVENTSAAVAAVETAQAELTVLPDYTRRPDDAGPATWPNVDGWGSLAGVLGTLATLGLLWGTARLLRRRDTTARA